MAERMQLQKKIKRQVRWVQAEIKKLKKSEPLRKTIMKLTAVDMVLFSIIIVMILSKSGIAANRIQFMTVIINFIMDCCIIRYCINPTGGIFAVFCLLGKIAGLVFCISAFIIKAGDGWICCSIFEAIQVILFIKNFVLKK